MRLTFVSAIWLASALCGLLGTNAAQAGTFSDPITVSLIAPGGLTTDGVHIDPTPVDVSQTLSPPNGSILPGGSGDISGYMLSAEGISLSGTTLLLTIAQGSSDGTTGYLGTGGQHARYAFSNLNIAGQTITGLNFTASGLSNLSAYTSGGGIKLTSPHSVEVDLDTLRFVSLGGGNSLNHADIAISFTTAPVPEPSSVALSLVGLLTVGFMARTRLRQPR